MSWPRRVRNETGKVTVDGHRGLRHPKGVDAVRRFLIGLPVLIATLTSCGRRPPTESILPEDRKMNTIRLQSPTFAVGGAIPKLHTCDGKDVSPPLEWSEVPDTAKSLALICEDPDTPRGTWMHWVIFGIPATVKGLGEGVPAHEWSSTCPGASGTRPSAT